jgi:hypothetical protein
MMHAYETREIEEAATLQAQPVLKQKCGEQEAPSFAVTVHLSSFAGTHGLCDRIPVIAAEGCKRRLAERLTCECRVWDLRDFRKAPRSRR